MRNEKKAWKQKRKPEVIAMNKSFTLLVLIVFTALSTFAFQAKPKAPADVAQA